MFSQFIFHLRRPFIFIALVTLVLSGCAAPASQAPTRDIYEEKAASSAGGAPSAPLMEAPAQPPAPGVAQDADNQAIERIVIKNGSLTIVVPDPVKSIDTISKMAEEMKGYVVSSNLYKEYASAAGFSRPLSRSLPGNTHGRTAADDPPGR